MEPPEAPQPPSPRGGEAAEDVVLAPAQPEGGAALAGGGFNTPSEPRSPSPPRDRERYYSDQQQQQSCEPGQEERRSWEAQNEGLMCIDQWDWKTDAPEFVPGSMKNLVASAAEAWTMFPAAVPGGRGAAIDSGRAGGCDNTRLSQIRQQYEWQLRTKSDELRELQTRMKKLEIETAQVRASWEIERRNLVRQIGHFRAVLERYCIPLEEAGSFGYGGDEGHHGGGGPHGSEPGGHGAGGQHAWNDRSHYVTPAPGIFGPAVPGGGPAEGAQLSSTLDSKMRKLNNLLHAEGQSQRRRSPSGKDNGASDGMDGGGSPDGANGGPEGGYSSGSIASTLRAMFPHATIRTERRPDQAGDELDSQAVAEMCGAAETPQRSSGNLTGPSAADNGTAGSSAAKEAAPEEMRSINQQLRNLERSTSQSIDERAMRAFQSLAPKEAREAVQKVEELVDSQGGHCRNLSSILQSVCRKIEKRSGKAARAEEEPSKPAGASSAGRGPTGGGATDQPSAGQGTSAAAAAAAAESARSRRARRADEEDRDAFDSSDSDDAAGKDHDKHVVRRKTSIRIDADDDAPLMRTTSMTSQASMLDTPAGRRSNRSWADIQSGDEEEQAMPVHPSHNGADPGHDGAERSENLCDEDGDYWTARLVDRTARRGFELRRRGHSEQWDLKISMAGLEPPLTQTGMERYCQWLRRRLAHFREEHGMEPLQHCRGEVDFSHNNMSNQMVWLLLETLAQNEVHTALLKLFANHISQGGVLAICEFIRQNERAEPLQELHMSHNKVDDDSALELLRTLHSQRPRYPPYRQQEGSSGVMARAPVWLRLNHNRIQDPDRVRRIAEAEGIAICTAWDRQVCGTSKCVRRECPLVHLYSFNVQAKLRPPVGDGEGGSAQDMEGGDQGDGDFDGAGDGRHQRRKRNRKGKGLKEKKEQEANDVSGEQGVESADVDKHQQEDGKSASLTTDKPQEAAAPAAVAPDSAPAPAAASPSSDSGAVEC